MANDVAMKTVMAIDSNEIDWLKFKLEQTFYLHTVL